MELPQITYLDEKASFTARVRVGPGRGDGPGTNPSSAPRLATALRACKKSSAAPPGGADACNSCLRLLGCTAI